MNVPRRTFCMPGDSRDSCKHAEASHLCCSAQLVCIVSQHCCCVASPDDNDGPPIVTRKMRRNNRSNLGCSHFIIGPAGCNLGNLWTVVCLCVCHVTTTFSMNLTQNSVQIAHASFSKYVLFLSNLGHKLELSCFCR